MKEAPGIIMLQISPSVPATHVKTVPAAWIWKTDSDASVPRDGSERHAITVGNRARMNKW